MSAFIVLLSCAAVARAMFAEEAGTEDWFNGAYAPWSPNRLSAPLRRLSFVGPPTHVVLAPGADAPAYIGTSEGVIAGLGRRDGELLWRRALAPDEPLQALVANTGNILLTFAGLHGAHVQRWDGSTGAMVWQQDVGTPSTTLPPGLRSSQLPPHRSALSVLCVPCALAGGGVLVFDSSHARSVAEVPCAPQGFDITLVTADVVTVLADGALVQLDLATGAVVFRAPVGATDAAGHTTVPFAAFPLAGGSFLVITRHDYAGYAAVTVATGVATAPAALVGLGNCMQFRRLGAHVLLCLDAGVLKAVDVRSLATTHVTLPANLEHPLFLTVGSHDGLPPTVVVVRASAGAVGAIVSWNAVQSKAEVTLLTGDITNAIFTTTLTHLAVVNAHSQATLLLPLAHLGGEALVPAVQPVSSVAFSPVTVATIALDGKGAGHFLVRARDGDVTLMTVATSPTTATPTARVWVRPEALGTAADAVFVDLPAPAHVTRLAGVVVAEDGSPGAGPVRDVFNAHKRILVLSRTGKVFGLDSATGHVAWSFMPELPGALRAAQMFVTRAPVFAHGLAVLVVTTVSYAAVVIQFDPTTGRVVQSLPWPHAITAVALAPVTLANREQVLLFIDAEKELATFFPATAEALTLLQEWRQPVVLHAVMSLAHALHGWLLQPNAPAASPSGIPARLAWALPLPADETVAAVTNRNLGERTNVLGDVLTDRTVMNKYLNPNLVALATLGTSDKGAARLTVLLVDVFVGVIVHSAVHDAVRGPVHLALSDNWLAYTFKNRKQKRYEIAMLEMFDAGNNAPDVAFASRDTTLPIVHNRTYVYPDATAAIAVTTTIQGIANKMVLLGRPSGAIFGVHKRLLDARRPFDPSRNYIEGLLPYQPMLPVSPIQAVNYNQTVERLAGIRTAGTELESTSLYFAFGLDLHAGRVHPSKKFDVLNADFSFNALSVSLISLAGLVLYLALSSAKKVLNDAWH